MISPKLAVLMATMAMIGIGTGALPTAAALQASEIEIERNNDLEQSIEQEQSACTNEVEGELSGEVEQDNFCEVDQTQTADNGAAIVDFSDNDFDLESILADVGLRL